MSGTYQKGAIALIWWNQYFHPDRPDARGIAARLRRARSGVDVLMEPAGFDLARRLGIDDADELLLIGTALAHVTEHRPEKLPKLLGKGSDYRMSLPRFQLLLTCPRRDLAEQIRSAVEMAGSRMNVASLASDLLDWGPAVHWRWCQDYEIKIEQPKKQKEVAE